MQAAFITKSGTKRSPTRSATGPGIRKIRKALIRGGQITFKRDRGREGRTVTFKLTGSIDVKTLVQDEGERRLRRRHCRSPNRNNRQR